jgi:hypothetical protein
VGLIRLARYRAESLTLLPAGPIVTEASASSIDESAAGAELTEPWISTSAYE